MNSLDIIVTALVLLLGIKGVIRGFVSELSGFIAIVGGIFVASRFSKAVSGFLAQTFHGINSTTATILAFILVFAIFWLTTVAAGGIIKKIVDSMGLNGFDKALGFIVSGGKIFLILSIIAFAIGSISLLKPKLQNFTKDSIAYPLMTKTGAFLINLTPEDLNGTKIADGAKNAVSAEVNKTIENKLNGK